MKKKKEEAELFFKSRKIIIKKNNSSLCYVNYKNFKINFPSSKPTVIFSVVMFDGVPFDKNSKSKYLSLLFGEDPYEHTSCQINQGDFVIDAGASFGFFTLFASKKIGKSGKIYSFEPVPETKKILEKNINENNVQNCKIAPFALGISNKKIEIFINDKNLEASSVIRKKNSLKRKESVGQLKLDTFIEENNISKVDFIKVDIEGAERDMLKGAENTIKKFKPKIAICTYHLPDDPEVLENILRELVPEYKIIHGCKKLYAYL